MEVVESKIVRLKAGTGPTEKGDPPMQLSPIMSMKTNGVKMSVSGFAIMLMKTQTRRDFSPYVYENKKVWIVVTAGTCGSSDALTRL
jgi:hypothetical protein